MPVVIELISKFRVLLLRFTEWIWLPFTHDVKLLDFTEAREGRTPGLELLAREERAVVRAEADDEQAGMREGE